MNGWSVVDTNVLVVANGRHEAADDVCVLSCIQALSRVRAHGIVVDEGREIFEQYRRHASHSGQPGLGDAFWKWLWDNQANEAVCIQVPLAWDHARSTYAEFPGDADLANFDRSDRVFVAVALVSSKNPRILNATDTDWWTARAALERNGIDIQFLCENLMHE